MKFEKERILIDATEQSRDADDDDSPLTPTKDWGDVRDILRYFVKATNIHTSRCLSRTVIFVNIQGMGSNFECTEACVHITHKYVEDLLTLYHDF